MNYFGRALADAFRFWPLLIIATLCSVGNGALWGLNIGALFPVIEVTIAGESLQQWIQDEIDSSNSRIASIESQVLLIQEQSADLSVVEGRPIGPGDKAKAAVENRLELLRSQLSAERAGLATSLKMQPYINRFLPPDPFSTVLMVMGCVMVFTFLKHLLQFTNTVLVALIAARITRRIQTQIFAKALSLDQTSFAGYASSGFMAHITYTTSMLSSGITSVYGGAIREPLKLVSCLIGAALICPRLLMLTMVVLPVVALLIYFASRGLKRVCKRLLEQSMGLHHVVLESLNNVKVVQAYCKENHEQGRFDRATRDMQRFTLKIVGFNALNRPLTELLGLGMLATAVIAGSYLVMFRATEILGVQITERPLGPASMLVFFGMLVGASDPLRKFSQVIDGINTGTVAANLLYPMLDQPSRIRDPEEVSKPVRPHAVLRFANVTFGYEPEHPVIENASLEIPHGSTVAIVGPNGSGKSSMMNLICRFYDPQRGRVCLDGVDVREMTCRDLRSRIGLVTQHTDLFNDNLYYNIGYGVENATHERCEQAAKQAHADEFIENQLPEKYATVIGENGHRLSGGQRQRIALARALIRNPDILILDEATSQIDTDSERLIFESIKTYCQEQTVLVITHRPEMLVEADMILRFEKGKIVVESGSAASLGKSGIAA